MSRLLMKVETVKPSPAVASVACLWLCSRALGTGVNSGIENSSRVQGQPETPRSTINTCTAAAETVKKASATEARQAASNVLGNHRALPLRPQGKQGSKVDVPQWRLEAHFRELCATEIGSTTEATQLVSRLVGLGLDVNTRLPTGQTLLHLATQCNAYPVVWQLLLLGADVNQTDATQTFTAMHSAISNGNPNTLQLLLDNGGAKWQRQDPSVVPETGPQVAFADPITYLERMYHCQRKVPLLHYAIKCNQPHLLQLLLHNGLNTEELYCSQTVLQYLVTFHQNVEPVRNLQGAVQLLLQYGADVNAAHAGMSVIQSAILGGAVDEDTLLMMIEAGADLKSGINEIHCRDGTMKTLLLAAVMSKNHRVAEMLLKQGADSEIVCQHNCTPLMWCVMMRDTAGAALLIKHAANVESDARTHWPPVAPLPPPLSVIPHHIPWTPINVAAAVMQDVSMVEILCEAGAEICDEVRQHVMQHVPHMRLALERPQWSRSTHSQFPDMFKENMKTFVLASKKVGPQLPNDALDTIAEKASYPIRNWCEQTQSLPVLADLK